MCNPDKIADTLAVRYAEVSRQKVILSISQQEKHEPDFKCERYRSYNMAFTMRELQSAVPASDDTVAGQVDIP